MKDLQARGYGKPAPPSEAGSSSTRPSRRERPDPPSEAGSSSTRPSRQERRASNLPRNPSAEASHKTKDEGHVLGKDSSSKHKTIRSHGSRMDRYDDDNQDKKPRSHSGRKEIHGEHYNTTRHTL